jgi:hypothetical protein
MLKNLPHFMVSLFRFAAVLLLLPFAACIDDPIDNRPTPRGNVYVKIHWDGLAPGDSLPSYGMHIQMYSRQGSSFIGYPLGVNGGAVWLPPSIPHASVCFDYAGMEYLNFRNMNNPLLLEAFNEPATYGTYNTRAAAGRDEPLVYESYPYTFYVAGDTPPFSAPAPTPSGKEIDTLHCYPRNVLHEFTFLVHGVEGVENVGSSRGAISGMSASCFLSSGTLSSSPSTVLFPRSLALEDGRSPEDFTWSTTDTLQRIPVAGYGSIPVSPKWFPAGWEDSETGWKGDWVIGAFSVFGPASPWWDIASQLTVECFSHADYHYYASWGYWKGRWDDTVTAQIMGSLGYWYGCPPGVEKGSPEAQTAWRRHNGGFDIVLANEGRLVIPPDVGLKAPVSGWDGVTVPLD